MLKAGLEKEYRDMILGHSLKGMDVHYLVLDEKTLIEAMNKFTKWVDSQLETNPADKCRITKDGIAHAAQALATRFAPTL